MIDPAAQARLERWKQSLLDLSAANRLLDVKDGRTTVPLPSVDPVWIAAALAEGTAFVLAPGAAEATDGDPHAGDDKAGGHRRLLSPLGAPELARRLVAIRRAARAQLADGGVHTLWLGLGMLTWCAAGATGEPELRRAPIALWPVALVRTDDGGVELVEAPGMEPRFNLTLGEKLRRDFGIALGGARRGGDDSVGQAGVEGGPELDVAALLDAADAIAASRSGWRLDRTAQLGIFSFAKVAMWNDLDARATELLDSPIVAHLAGGGGAAFDQPSRAAAGAVIAASGAATGELIAPLDADASQLAAIAAAGTGASFVLQGPPGTGKSQTIANLIVHCVTHGKTVLFVADKMAALEVVQQRLAAVGLGDFCLELHSHKAVRGQVVAQLGRVLERAFRPVAGPGGGDARLAELRAALDGHVAALHRVGPFGRSLHHVLGRLVELRTTPRAALAERDAIALDRAAFERRKLAVEALAAAAGAVEPVAAHPWRACTMERWPLDGKDGAKAALDEAEASAVALELAVQGVATLVPGLMARTRDQLTALGALAALAAKSPRPGAELLTQLRLAGGDDVVERIALVRARGSGAIDPPRDPGSFLVLANRHRLLATEVNDRFTDSVAELDPHALWIQLRRWTHRLAPLRFMALRETRAAVRAAAMPGMLEADGVMITALESVIAERAARAALLAAAEPARRWFGDLGGDPLELDLARIDDAVTWAAELRLAFDAIDIARGDSGRAAAWRALVAQVAANPAADYPAGPAGGELGAFARLAEATGRWRSALARLTEATGIDAATVGAGADHLAALGERIEALRRSLDGMRDWVAFHGARHAALAAGTGPAVAAIERGDLGAGELAAAWERATLLAWADAELVHTPALARFHGAAHHAHVAAFADLDRATLALMRSRALVRLAERVPRVTAEPGGELGALLHEIRKQRGHRPLRRLFREIPTLLPTLAPCLLMSPLSVAQYLDPGLPRFDVVVFDEASQLPTADAIGALARGDAAIVVGDSRQLPPTRFFAAGAGPADDTDELDDVGDVSFADPGELESVLDDCIAARLPELRLTWHYRSRHEDLIAFANQRYYGDRLQVFPAAARSPELGISRRRVAGVYDRAGSRQNRIEAEAVVAEVLARLRDPAHGARSIGVVTFSRAQRELIEDLLDAAREQTPGLDRFFETSADRTEPVIIKNLEAIQGDERDVVILSVGYGPSADGAFSMNLGPLSQRGGERRLNVAITRAREQLILVSSFDPEDLAGASGQGAQDLAAVLAFARAGGGAARAQAADAAPARPVVVVAGASPTRPVAIAADASPTRPVAVVADASPTSPIAVAADASPTSPVAVAADASPTSPVAVAADASPTSPVAVAADASPTTPVIAATDAGALGSGAAAAESVSRSGDAGRGSGAMRPLDEATADADPASPITAAIARALVERGWTVRHQVGCGAYKVDLAIADPGDSDRYVLAIETDGEAYASAPAARDRDRLRAQMLGQLGWRTHRIWALDWWADPEREIQRAHGAIVTAVATNRQRRPATRPGEALAQRRARPAGSPTTPSARRESVWPAPTDRDSSLQRGRAGALAEKASSLQRDRTAASVEEASLLQRDRAAAGLAAGASSSRRDGAGAPPGEASSLQRDRVAAAPTESDSSPHEGVAAAPTETASRRSAPVSAGRGAAKASSRISAPVSAGSAAVKASAPDRDAASAGSAAVKASAPDRDAASSGSAAAKASAPDRDAASASSAAVKASARDRGAGSAGRAAAATSSTAGSGPVAGARPGDRTAARGAVAAGSGPTDAVAALLGDSTARVASGSAPIRIARNAIAIGPYLAAAIPAGRRAPDDLFAPRHVAELGKIIEQVLAAEAPMHIDALARRVGAYFGIGRPTARVTDQVRGALAGRGRWGEEDNIVWRLDQDPAGVPSVRVTGQAASARRAIDEVPLAEVAAAARIVVERAVGIAAGDLVRDAARLLGFARVTDRVVQRVASGVRLAAQRDLIRIDGGKATLPD